MKKIINGKIYDTSAASRICQLQCGYYPSDFGYHETHLYRTKRGAFFLAGEGNAASMWASSYGNTRGPGSGLRVVDQDRAMRYAESANLDESEMLAAGFAVDEA